MGKVQFLPWFWTAAGFAALAALLAASSLSVAGWLIGAAYLLVSSLLVARALSRTEARRFGPANATTATRSLLVGLIAAVVGTSVTQPVPSALVVGLTVPALVLDALDGWLARRTGTVTELGGRFDMEVDAFLLLVLSVDVARTVGPWVLAIGLMRYVFVAVGSAVPWMRGRLPFRYWRKVVTAACGIVLTLAATGWTVSWVSAVVVGAALLLLVESFGRDVIWLARRREPARPRRRVTPGGSDRGAGERALT